MQARDWLAKIAEEQGSTVAAIWGHPENADLRARRGSPDVPFPGDVLHIPVASPIQLPVVPPPPLSPGKVAPEGVPWPYEPFQDPSEVALTWECPEDSCACHPVAELDEERIDHIIVLHDPQGRRMPLARCRVVEHGPLITPDPTTASSAGELSFALRVSTRTLLVEWAPPDLPGHQTMPYRKRYHVRPKTSRRRAAGRLHRARSCRTRRTFCSWWALSLFKVP